MVRSEDTALLVEKTGDGGEEVARVADELIRLLPAANVEVIVVAVVADDGSVTDDGGKPAVESAAVDVVPMKGGDDSGCFLKSRCSSASTARMAWKRQ